MVPHKQMVIKIQNNNDNNCEIQTIISMSTEKTLVFAIDKILALSIQNTNKTNVTKKTNEILIDYN